jgi:hypothetical protein
MNFDDKAISIADEAIDIADTHMHTTTHIHTCTPLEAVDEAIQAWTVVSLPESSYMQIIVCTCGNVEIRAMKLANLANLGQ